MPDMVLRMEDFPAPFAPMRVTISPWSTSKETPLTALMLPYVTFKLHTERSKLPRIISPVPYPDRLPLLSHYSEFARAGLPRLLRRNREPSAVHKCPSPAASDVR